MKLDRTFLAIGVMAAAGTIWSCGSTPNTGTSEEKALLHSRTQSVMQDFKTQDPTIQRFIDSAEAYAIFPHVVTGALILGGAHGQGEVYEKGKLIGYADVSQGSVGAQLGGQSYAEVIFFQNEMALVDFKYGTSEFDARATAVAASRGAAAAADYRRGVIIFTLPESGLMAQAAIGMQKFRYMAVEK